MDKFLLNFISQDDFENHVTNTIIQYMKTLRRIDLAKFNSNLIDLIRVKNKFRPIYGSKLVFKLLGHNYRMIDVYHNFKNNIL